MTDSTFPSSIDTTSWSLRLGQRYGLVLPPDVASWFDDELWRGRGPGEYCLPVSPEVLLSDCPESIWPPLMPPFFLPLIGHPGGDWLCLRLLDGPLSHPTSDPPFHVNCDICQWYHGGGDWLPWGGTLAEALLLDCVMPRLPSAEQLHAVAAEPSTATMSDGWLDSTWGRWLVDWLPRHNPASEIAVSELAQMQGFELADAMCQAHWCEAAVRCQCVIALLDNELRKKIEPKLANRLGIAWNDLMRWCFDLRTLPLEIAEQLVRDAGFDPAATDPTQQDWPAIQQHALAVSQVAPDLAWGHELLGYCHHSSNDRTGAAAAWQQALRCSVFTDQSVRLRTHWATTGAGKPAKFAAFFLDHSDLHSAPQTTSLYQVAPSVNPIDYWNWLRANLPAATIRQNVMNRLRELSHQCTGDSQHFDAISLLVAAGWDLGAEPMRTYSELLDELITACQQAAWTPHAQLALTHRRCLTSRYGI